MNKNKKNGLTILEVLIVVSFLSLLSAMTIFSFSNLSKRELIVKEVNNIVAILNEARSLTLSSEGDSQYGVRIENNKVVFFKGDSFEISNPNNRDYILSPKVTILSDELVGGPDIVYKRLTGSSDQYGSIFVVLVSDPNTSKQIKIFSTGVVEIK